MWHVLYGYNFELYIFLKTEVASLYIPLPMTPPSSVFFVFALFLAKKNKMHFKYELINSYPGLLHIRFTCIYQGFGAADLSFNYILALYTLNTQCF